MSPQDKGAIVELSKDRREKKRQLLLDSKKGGVTPKYLDNFYQSMPQQMQAVIAAKGGQTKY